MNRTLLRAALAVVLVAGVFALAGCSASSSAEKTPKVWGYVAAPENAKLEVSATQPDMGVLAVDRVVAPGPSWVVVHEDDNGMPGKRVGLAHVDPGSHTNVLVRLKRPAPSGLIVALHADRGTTDKFDFDMMKKEMSPDRPYFVGGQELAKTVQLN